MWSDRNEGGWEVEMWSDRKIGRKSRNESYLN